MSSPWQLREAIAAHRPGDWIMDALCPEVSFVDFFPNKSESSEPAKRICRMCPVAAECAEYALTAPSLLHGVWGGMSATERKEIRRRNGIRDVELFEDWHGTERGERRHRRAGEQPCRPCLDAANTAARTRIAQRKEVSS